MRYVEPTGVLTVASEMKRPSKERVSRPVDAVAPFWYGERQIMGFCAGSVIVDVPVVGSAIVCTSAPAVVYSSMKMGRPLVLVGSTAEPSPTREIAMLNGVKGAGGT